ncbi:agmatinase [Candidatus Bathyarchaeota archaeon]|nr:MAG: agmatinase [Candidatus Bathyarchaeota archaeon]
MSFIELYVRQTLAFAGSECRFEDADYIIVGVPFDNTSSYRPGSRFAPRAIREASLNIEGFSFRSNRSIDDLRIHDAGDLDVSLRVEETLRRLELVTREIIEAGKTPVLIGGEHTLTIGSVKAIDKPFKLLCFDAHLDLRDEYLDMKFSHATVIRRICETNKNLEEVIIVGARAACKEEIEYAKKKGVHIIPSREILDGSIRDSSSKVNRLLGDAKALYLSLDMDVLDPAFAPAVQTPEPEGISTHQLLNMISEIDLDRLVAFDITEMTPPYDFGATSAVAAKIIFEVLLQKG